MKLSRQAGALFVIVTVVLVAYWPVAAMLDSLKWDTLDCFFPWRSFVADCISKRVFPLWNPYQHLGYPIFADMRSVFYPEPWIVGLFGGYSMQWLHGLYIFYLVMAALGMYNLVGNYVKSQPVQVIIACSYALSGFFVGHGQDMAVYVSGAWIPWSLNHFLRLQEHLWWEDVWKLTLFMFLHLTGGYHALNIVCVHLLLILGAGTFLSNIISGRVAEWRKQLLLNGTASIFAAVSILVLIVTYLQASPHVGRLTGLSLKQVYVGFLAPRSLSSLLTPFAVTYGKNLPETDMTMQNIYVGIVVLVFFIVGLSIKKKLSLKLLLGFGAVCLLASLGPHTPVREFLYEYIPGMNLFRMSSFFSYFSQLAILLTAAVGLELFIKNSGNTKRFLYSFGFILAALLAGGIVAYTDWPQASLTALENLFDLQAIQDKFSFSQRVVVHTVIQLAVMSALFLLFWFRRSGSNLILTGLALIIFAEMVISVRLNHSSTIGGGFDPKELQERLDDLPEGFPFPDVRGQLKWTTDAKPAISPLYHNTNILTKTVSADGFNSFTLERFTDLTDNRPDELQQALKKPLVHGKHPETLIRFSEFTPNQFVFSVQTTKPDSITLHQVFFPGWKIRVNGLETDYSLNAESFPTFAVSSKNNEVVFAYENPSVKIAWLISVTVLLLIVSFIIFHSVKGRNISSQKAALVSFLSIVLLLTTFGLRYNKTSSNRSFKIKHYQSLCMELVETISESSTPLVLQIDDSQLMDSLLLANGIENPTIYAWNAGGSEFNAIATLHENTSNAVIHAGWNQPKDMRITELLIDRWSELTEIESNEGFILKHGFGKSEKPELLVFNDFESSLRNPNYTVPSVDSTVVSYSGMYAWEISDGQLGSPGIRVQADSLAALKEPRFVFQTQCLIPTKDVESANMYIQIERKGENIWEATARLNQIAQGYAGWFPAVLVARPDVELLSTDLLKAFVWGSAGDPLYLDDMSFAVYRHD